MIALLLMPVVIAWLFQPIFQVIGVPFWAAIALTYAVLFTQLSARYWGFTPVAEPCDGGQS